MAVYAKGHYNKFQAVIYKLISSKGVLNLYLGEKMMNPPTPAQLGEKREKEEREEAVLKKEQLQSFYTLGKNTNTERRGWENNMIFSGKIYITGSRPVSRRSRSTSSSPRTTCSSSST